MLRCVDDMYQLLGRTLLTIPHQLKGARPFSA